MAEITQRLGFEAKGAITTLNELSIAIAGVNRRLNTFNKRANQTAAPQALAGFQNLQAAAIGADQALAQNTKSFRQTGKAGKEAGASITVSWETMLRVVQTQVLVRVLNQAIRLFGESADAAQEFQLIMAQTAVITRGAGGAFDELVPKVRELSAAIGRPLEEVANTTFEAMQRQLGTVTETIDLMQGSVHQLALSARGELFDAFQVTSDVIKAYNLDLSAANDIADIFFVTTDRGNLILSDFRNQLGRILPLSSVLKIGVDEVGASIAALTLQGLDGATAMTQLRNVMNALVKPSKDMTDAFRRLGVESGTELIEKTGGVVNALLALRQSVDGNEEAFGRLFGRIRGTLGALSLTANEASIFNDIMGDMEDRAGRAADAMKQIEEIDARRAQRAMEDLNRVINELGDTTLRIRIAMVETLTAIISSGAQARDVIAILSLGVGGLTARFIALRFAALAALAPIAPAAFAAGAALTLAFATEKITDYILELNNVSKRLDGIREQAEKDIVTATKIANKEISDETKRSLEERAALSDNWVKRVTGNYDRVTTAARAMNDTILQDARFATSEFVKSREQAVEEMRKTIESIDKQILDSTERVRKGLQNLEDFRFERALQGLTEQEQAAKLIERALNQAAEARELAAKAGLSEEERRIAREKEAAAARSAQEALRLADRTENAALIERAERAVEETITTGISNEIKARNELASMRTADMKKALQEVEERFGREKELLEEILELQQRIQDPANTRETKLVDLENLQEAKAEFRDLLKEDFDVDLFKQLGTQDFINRATSGLRDSFETANFQLANVRAAVQRALDEGPFRVALQVASVSGAPTGVPALDDATQEVTSRVANPAQRAVEQEQALRRVVAEQQKLNNEMTKQEQIAQANLEQLRRSMDEGVFTRMTAAAATFNEKIAQVFDVQGPLEFRNAMVQVAEAIEGVESGTEARVQQQIDAAKELLRSLLEQGQVTASQAEASLAAIQAAERALEARIKALAAEQEFIGEEGVRTGKQRIQEIEDAVNAADMVPDDADLDAILRNASESAKNLDSSLQRVSEGASGTAEQMGQAADNTGQADDNAVSLNFNTSSATSAANALASAWASVAAQAERAAAAAAQAGGGGGGGPVPAYHGGKMTYRAVGGPIMRGQDTIHAMVAPGERIINSRASANFAAELDAMNAHQRPQYREHGGAVTNIGDINVSVQTDSTRGVSGSDLAATLRRELRRKTSVL